jgi:hypothetical protein
MPPAPKNKVGERLYWSYANLAMAAKAINEKAAVYRQLHYIIRARLYAGLRKGTMSPTSLMRDQRSRMKMPQECIYCGSDSHLAVDHIVPLHRGGVDSGDNSVWACRRCNSSKSGRDVFEWWFARRVGFPPLFIVRVYLKQAIAYCLERGLMDHFWADLHGHPFSFVHIPTDYPSPATLIFSPAHSRRSQGSPSNVALSPALASA